MPSARCAWGGRWAAGIPVTRHDLRTFSTEQIADGWRLACLVQATRNLEVEVPPLTTRPKAATVGVGRQVILRPPSRSGTSSLEEATLADQRTDLARLTDAITDLELTADLHALRRLATVLRQSDFKVTAVVVDEDLVDVEPGDTTASRYAIAFDLGTTTVVATLLDVGTGTPLAVASMLNKQQPFGGDVITRISATMMDKDTLGRLQEAAGATLAEPRPPGLPRGRRRPGRGLRGRGRRERHDDRARPRHRPRAARRRAVRHVVCPAPTVLAADIGLALHPRARAFFFPALGAYVGGDIVAACSPRAWTATSGPACSSTSAPTARSCSATATRSSPRPPAGPAFEGGAIRCGMRGRRGDRGDRLDPAALGDEPAVTSGDRRRGAAWAVRLGTGRRGGRTVGSGCSTGLGAPGAGRPRGDPALADRLAKIGEERVFVLHHQPRRRHRRVRLPVPARRPRAQFAKAAISTGGRCCSSRLGLEHRRAAGAAGRVVRQLPRPPPRPSGSGWSHARPCSASSPRATSPAKGPRWPCCRCASAPAPPRCWRRWPMSSLSDRLDFNDKFVEQPAF